MSHAKAKIIYVSPYRNMEEEKGSIFLSELYRYLDQDTRIDAVSLKDTELLGHVALGGQNKSYLINWIDMLFIRVLVLHRMSPVLRELVNLLFLPVFLVKIVFFYMRLKRFLRRNRVFFYCHDLQSFNRSYFVRFIDKLCRPLFLKYGEHVFFAETACQVAVEEFWNVPVKSSTVVSLGRYHSLSNSAGKVALRAKHGIPADKLILIFPGTVRKGFRSLSPELERALLKSNIFLLKVGRGHKAINDAINCRVVSGFIDQNEFEELVAAADYSIIPSEFYLTSAVARTSIGLRVPVIAPDYGSVVDMCLGCMVDIKAISGHDENLDGLIPSPTSEEYLEFTDECIKRHSERVWDTELEKLVNVLTA